MLAIGGAFCDSRSIGDSVMRGQRSNFRKIDKFSTIHDDISNIINRSDIGLSPASSPFTSEQNEVSLQFIDGIFLTHSIPEENSVTLIGKIA